MTTPIMPPATDAARSRSSVQIPAVRVPSEPTEAELAACEERLAETELRARSTRRPGRRK